MSRGGAPSVEQARGARATAGEAEEADRQGAAEGVLDFDFGP